MTRQFNTRESIRTIIYPKVLYLILLYRIFQYLGISKLHQCSENYYKFLNFNDIFLIFGISMHAMSFTIINNSNISNLSRILRIRGGVYQKQGGLLAHIASQWVRVRITLDAGEFSKIWGNFLKKIAIFKPIYQKYLKRQRIIFLSLGETHIAWESFQKILIKIQLPN